MNSKHTSNDSNALWIATSRIAAHETIVQPLSEPSDGTPRIHADYSTTTPMQTINTALDAPVCTELIIIINNSPVNTPDPAVPTYQSR